MGVGYAPKISVISLPPPYSSFLYYACEFQYVVETESL